MATIHDIPGSQRLAKDEPAPLKLDVSEAFVRAQPLNPYVAGGALGDPGSRSFYGREDVFEFVYGALNAEQRSPILLFGQRRIGKSSVLKQLQHVLSPALTTVYFDLQGKASMTLDLVLYGLARAMADRLSIRRPTREEATEESFPALFLPRAIEALGGLAERLVVLFDEFDVLDEQHAGEDVAARRFIGYLGVFCDRQPKIGIILVVGRKTEELSGEVNSALIKNSLQKRIGRLDRKQAIRLVLEPSAGSLAFTNSALERIVYLANGHPFCTQLLCYTLWARHVREGAALPVEITSQCVDEALGQALEFGTNGINWIYDGLVESSHRLFLSAVADVANPLKDEAASYPDIEAALKRRQVATDAVHMSLAPGDLEKWDIVTRDNNRFRITVPMVGTWIRRERSLDRLEKEVRQANPRAYKYFELALEAHRAQDLDRAIEDYKSAVQANPAFLDAFLGMAMALRERRRPGGGDLEYAIDAYENVQSLNPEMGRSLLVSSIVEFIEAEEAAKRYYVGYVISERVRRLVERYARLMAIDPGGTSVASARRSLHEIARFLYHGEFFEQAAKLAEAIGDQDLSVIMGDITKRLQRWYIVTLSLRAAGLLVLVGLPFDVIETWLRSHSALIVPSIGLAAVGGAAGAEIVGRERWSIGYLETGNPRMLQRAPAGITARLVAGGLAGGAVGISLYLLSLYPPWVSAAAAFISGFVSLIVLRNQVRKRFQSVIALRE